MAGTTMGDHLNTQIFLVAIQLCVWGGYNQVGNNSVDKTDIVMARRTSYASSTLSLSLHTTQNLNSSKALFLFLFDDRSSTWTLVNVANINVYC